MGKEQVAKAVMRMKCGTTVLLVLCLMGAMPSHAQQRGQYIPGQQGLNSGVLPDPGVTYANMAINYSADTLRDATGNKVPLTGSYDLWANAFIIFYVPHFKVLGAKVSLMAAPTVANGSGVAMPTETTSNNATLGGRNGIE